MKFLIAFVAIAAVASAGIIKPVGNEVAQIEAIVAAINHPSTDPATALLLEQQLMDLLGVAAPAPVVVDPQPEPISVGPAVIDFPVPDGGAVTAVEPPSAVQPAPVVVLPVAPVAESSPLVQIILNINAPASAVAVENPMPVVVPEPIAVPEPVLVVEDADNSIVLPPPVILPIPVVIPEPVQVVEVPPTPAIIPEPVLVVEPTLPVAPAVVLPDQLN